jgi:hypothetical protein
MVIQTLLYRKFNDVCILVDLPDNNKTNLLTQLEHSLQRHAI